MKESIGVLLVVPFLIFIIIVWIYQLYDSIIKGDWFFFSYVFTAGLAIVGYVFIGVNNIINQ